MSENIARIKLTANYISAGTSLADNPAVKVHKLENLEKDIIIFLSHYQLTKNQELLRQSVLKTISDLKLLNGQDFRCKSLGLSGQVSLLLEIASQS